MILGVGNLSKIRIYPLREPIQNEVSGDLLSSTGQRNLV